jgi:starch synthase
MNQSTNSRVCIASSRRISLIVIYENIKMSNPSAQPRILFVIPEVAFIPEGEKTRHNFTGARTGGFGDYLAEIISDLIYLGVDVHVAQPDYRRIFGILARNEQTTSGIKLPNDRVQLAEDRAFFYSKPINSNSEWENIKISLAFQREIINQIIPRVQPDLIHCYDWMTGLLPAAANKFEIPCLFTVHKLDTAKSLLSYVEDMGIDAAGFWQNLFYTRFPGSYEQTRASNPMDLLLSGILAARHVDTAGSELFSITAEGRSNFMYWSLGQLLVQKWNAGCACGISGFPHQCIKPIGKKKSHCNYGPKDQHAGKQITDPIKRRGISSSDKTKTAEYYIDLYEAILRRSLVVPYKKKGHPLDKYSRANISDLQAISYRKALLNG